MICADDSPPGLFYCILLLQLSLGRSSPYKEKALACQLNMTRPLQTCIMSAYIFRAAGTSYYSFFSLFQPSKWMKCEVNSLKEHLFFVFIILNPSSFISQFHAPPISTSPLLHEAKLSAVESSNCMCRTPCNMTRYNKELSMVKIPSKTSARYLQKKFNKSEKYIT